MVIAEARLAQLIETIEQTPPYLRGVTLSIRSCWSLKTKDIPAFTKFQDDFLEEAAVLKKFLVPFTLAVLCGLEKLFDEYVKSDFVVWNGVIGDIGDVAVEYERLFYCLLTWYEHFLADLQKLPAMVAAVTAEVPPEIVQCRQMAKMQYIRSSIGDGTFVSLLFIPEVGQIAAPLIVGPGGRKGSVQPTIVSSQFEVAAAAALTTTDTLVPAVAKVMSLLRVLHGIFEELSEEFAYLIGEDPENKDYKQEERLKHYTDTRVLAFHVQKKCRQVDQTQARFGSDCESVPNYLVPRYPQEWLESKTDKDGYDLADLVHACSKNVAFLDLLEPAGV